MYPGLDIYRFLQTLYENLQQQQARLASLEQLVKQMDGSIQQLQEKPTTRIDKIEYHFDQLKVETLEGTLNIGITPQTEAEIESYQAGPHMAQDLKTEKPQSPIFTGIQREVNRYLGQEASTEIVKLERLYGVTLDEDYRAMMVDDVRRQIDGRIREYLQRLHGTGKTGESQAIEADITYKVKNDVQTAFRNYFNNLPKQGGTSDENGSHQ